VPPRAADSTHRGSFSRRDAIKGLAAAGIGALGGVGAHGFLYARHQLELTQQTLTIGGWPQALAGFRIGFITDLHRSETVPHEMVTSAVHLLMSQHPDLVILGGDYITNLDRRFVAPAAEALAGLTSPNGVIAVLGNHDDERDMPAALAARGFTVLKDARTQLRINGEVVEFAGLRYWTRRVTDISRVLRGAAASLVLLAHTPSRLIEAAALSVPLLLSGHTHGGQIVLPGLGAVAARRFPIVAGAARRDNTVAFVSRGVGTVYIPVRVNCPPEVAILTLKPAMEV
jgi:predicted MPP superfamily phosphohydrolase